MQMVPQIQAVLLYIRFSQVVHFTYIDDLVPDLAQRHRRRIAQVRGHQPVHFSVIRNTAARKELFPDLLLLNCSVLSTGVFLAPNPLSVLDRSLSRHFFERAAESR